MKTAIMQPYLFPYIGYFQLIHAVDLFVVYDDVNYIKRGWINRNYILSNSEKLLITLPLEGASQNIRINQLSITPNHRILKTLRHSYSKAPFFDEVYPVIENIMANSDRNLANFLDHQLRCICEYLNLCPQWRASSAINIDASARGQDRILALCGKLGTKEYINLPGGKSLYDRNAFERRGVKLSFLDPRILPYKQYRNEFLSGLSIIDVIMFNSRAHCADLLAQYELTS